MDDLPYEYLLYIECQKKPLHTIFKCSFTFPNSFYTIFVLLFYLLPYKYIKKEVPIPQHLIATLHNTMRRIIIRRRYFEFTRKNKIFIQIMQNIDSLWNLFSFYYNQSKVFVLTRLCIVLCNVYSLYKIFTNFTETFFKWIMQSTQVFLRQNIVVNMEGKPYDRSIFPLG